MSRSDIEAGKAFVRLYMKDDMSKKLGMAIGNAGRKMQSFALPVLVAGGAITGVMGVAVKIFAAAGDKLDKLSLRTGVGAGALAELGFAAEQSGADMDTVEKAIKRQAKGILDLERGMSTAVDAFGALGLGIEDIQGLKPEDQFQLIADRLKGIEDPTRRAALAQEVFGKAGTSLIPMLGNLRELRKEAKDLGIVPADDEVANAAKVTDAINRIKRTLGAMMFNAGAALAEPVLAGLENVKKVTVFVSKWISENKQLVRTIAAVGVGLLAAGAAIFSIGTLLVGAGAAIASIGSIMGVIGGAIALVLSPVGLLTAAVVGGIAAFVAFTDTGKEMAGSLITGFGSLLEKAKAVFGGIYDAIAGGDFKKAGKIAMLSLKVAILSGLDAIRGLVGDTVADFAGELLSGDFTGAWATTVGAMADMWNSFTAGITEAFAGAVISIQKMWTQTQNTIATSLIDQAGKDGPLGAAARFILGVDMREENAKRARLDEQLGLSGPSASEEAKAILDEATKRSQDKFATEGFGGKTLDWAKEARRKQREAADRFEAEREARRGTRDESTGDAQKELDRLMRPSGGPGPLSGLTEWLNNVSITGSDGVAAGEAIAGGPLSGVGGNLSTFSAAGAIAAGYGAGAGTPQQKMADDIHEVKKLTAEQAEWLKGVADSTAATVGAIDSWVAKFAFR
jgi:hypothetical protein